MATTCTGDSIVQVIERTECIGNSLPKINSNFKALDAAICELQSTAGDLSQAEGILKGENQQIAAATPGVDYTIGTVGLRGLLKTDITGTISTAVSSVDYYVPHSVLEAFDTTINGTLSTNNVAWFDSINVKNNASINGMMTVAGDIVSRGVVRADGDIIAFNSSDERLKNNITTITNATDKLLNIRGVEYEWDTEKQSIYTGNDVGVIAQEIEKILPAAVIDRDTGFKSVNYIKIIPLLIESIKELKKEIDTLKNQK